MNSKGGKKAPKKKTNGYQMAEPIKKDEILTDIKKNQWIIGRSIGIGGFGEIYEAAAYSGKIPKDYPAVIKIEPHGNGPLFVEMHFYMRNASPNEIDAWRKQKKLPHLGMPKFLGSGSHEYNGTKYRFLVVEKYGTDLWKLFNENQRSFPEHTVYNVALQVIDVLEYIHAKKYIHGDIKGGNLLLDLKSQKNIYLVDFGLACHSTTKEEFKPDPKKAHDGTPEYTSRDAHQGVPTMRGDMEILGYNVIQWLCGTLPWEHEKDPTKTQKKKIEAFKNLNDFLKSCFSGKVPEAVTEYMKLVDSIDFHEFPNYDKFKSILINGISRLKKVPYSKLEFENKEKAKSTTTKKTKTQKDSFPEVNLEQEIANKGKGKKASKIVVKDNVSEENSTVLDAKFTSGAEAINHILENVDMDSESEYDIQIKKRKKKEEKIGKSETPSKVKRGQNMKVESSSEDDKNNYKEKEKKSSPKKVRGKSKTVTPTRTSKRATKKVTKYIDDSSDDMFV